MRATLLVCVFLTAATAALAEHPWHIQTHAGVSIPLRTRDYYTAVGSTFGVALFRDLAPALSVGLRVAGDRWGVHYVGGSPPRNHTTDGAHWQLQLIPSLRFQTVGNHRVDAFLQSGLSFRSTWDVTRVDDPTLTIVDGNLETWTISTAMVDAGAGVSVRASARCTIELVPLWHHLLWYDHDPDFVSTTLGLSYSM
jgi:hypothetical protein